MLELLKKQILYFDGGTGTVLQKWGLKQGELPEDWNLKYPEKIQQLHYQYFTAGANIVKTNTFGCFTTKFPLNLEKIIKAGIQNANLAREKALEYFNSQKEKKSNQPEGEKSLFIAFDISSCGRLLKPMGDLDFEDCVSLFKKTFKIAFDCQIDCVLIETMNDGYETKAAVLAAKEVMEEKNLFFPIFVTNVYDQNSRTLSGSTPETMVAMLEGLGVDALGVNCSLGPKEMLPTVKRLYNATNLPLIVNPNAGLPRVINGETVFDVSKEDFAETMEEILKSGAAIIGGCCGTTPEYIKYMSDKFGPEPIQKVEKSDLAGKSVISSNSKSVYFGPNQSCVLIGERINPTGKKKFKEALRNNDIAYIIQQGIEQEEKGAQVLDVNVGLPEINEEEMMVKVLTELQSVTEVPLQIDTTNPKVMEAALRLYNGKALINSVNGKEEIMKEVFPLVKKYGGLVVALTLDENGIPPTAEGRIEIAKKIYAEAEKYNISKKDIIIDPLAMAVSSDSQAALATLQTVKALSQMGGNTSLGISNVSFGLPKRDFVTAAFFTMAMENGLSAAIMNPLQVEMQKAFYTFNLLKGYDTNCQSYIQFIENNQKEFEKGEVSPSAPASAKAESCATLSAGDTPARPPETNSLEYSIIHGLKENAASKTKELLEKLSSLEIINNHLIPGLDFVGKRFEEKTMYLPQLLMAAEAAKAAFSEIRSYMEKTGKKGQSKGKIIIATVKGDIHDIGKNIVKVLLENYDFTVIDLGKDVDPQTVLAACKKDKVKLIGLSALMTTTVVSMEETIKLLKKECPWCKICVGGAVLTQEYADMINADFYAKDAMDTVRWAEKNS